MQSDNVGVVRVVCTRRSLSTQSSFTKRSKSSWRRRSSPRRPAAINRGMLIGVERIRHQMKRRDSTICLIAVRQRRRVSGTALATRRPIMMPLQSPPRSPPPPAMRRPSIPTALGLALATLLVASPASALHEMTRQQIIGIAQSGVGYSYWWGKGRWRTDSASPGSCVGSCPRCSHTGSYGRGLLRLRGQIMGSAHIRARQHGAPPLRHQSVPLQHHALDRHRTEQHRAGRRARVSQRQEHKRARVALRSARPVGRILVLRVQGLRVWLRPQLAYPCPPSTSPYVATPSWSQPSRA